MIMALYKRALGILMRKPFRLWGISLLGAFLAGIAGAAFGIIPVIGIAISMLFEVSLAIILLRGLRGEENPRAVDLFETFKDWKTVKRVLCGMGWMLLWIFLWALIPIVGWIFAIIRTYQYRLTPYILMEEPDVKPTDAIKVSKERTKGWKGKMFGADILIYIFFGVALAILGLLGAIPFVGWLFRIIAALLFICFCVLIPLFMGLVKASFYEEIQKWGTYPGRQAYAPAKPKPAAPAPGSYPPPGYDPSQQYQQYQQYPPQQPTWQGQQPQQPNWQGQQPQQPNWQQPNWQQPNWQPQQPTWQQPPQQEYPPQQPAWQPPQQPQPTWQPPQPPQQPTWQPPEPPAAPEPPEGWQEPPQE